MTSMPGFIPDSYPLSPVGDRRLGVEQREDSFGARHGCLQNVVLLGQVLERLEEAANQLEKRRNRANRECVGVDA